MSKISKLALAVLVPAGLLISTAAIFLTEGAIHIPARRRFAPHTEIADRISSANLATWSEPEITAADGARLKAWLFRPARWNGSTVLVLHGHFDTREGTAGFAPMLLRHGYAALVPDNRAHGASGGGLVTYGVLERDDVKRWVALAASATKAEEGAQRIYGLGESMGAAILLQTLAIEPRIRAAVAEGSFRDFRSVAYQRVGRSYGLPNAFSALFVEPAFLYLRVRYGLALDTASPLSAIRQSHTPVFYIHGTGDTNIPPEDSRELFAARRTGSQLWQPERATHIKASAYYPEEFERRVIGWFDSH